MLEYMFELRDTKAEIWMYPYFNTTEQAGQREFIAACRDENTPMGKFPEDYTLYVRGTRDRQTGVYDIYDDPKQSMTGFEIRQLDNWAATAPTEETNS